MIFPPVIDVKHHPYCGPSAIALLTGVPVSRVEKMIRRCRKGWRRSDGAKLPVRGTYTSEVVKVLKRLGCKVAQTKVYEGTFAKFVDDTRHAGTFLVEVTGHFMVCSGGFFADSTWTTPRTTEEYNKGLRRVKRAWQVSAPSMPKYTVEDSLVASRPKKPKPDIKVVRAAKVEAGIKRWERKEKLAKTKLKKLRAKLKYYAKQKVETPAT